MTKKRVRYSERGSAFENLPVELLGQITSSLDPNSIQALSRTSRAIHASVESHGWREFVVSHFPSYKGPPLWRNASHSLTRLTKAWETRALNARIVLPDADIQLNPIQPPHGDAATAQPHRDTANNHSRSAPSNAHPAPRRWRGGQTMGYQPVLDVKERWTGSRWTDRQEILAVGAGAELLIRNRDMGELAGIEGLKLDGGLQTFDNYGHCVQWQSWKDPVCRDGHDDITMLKFLHQEPENAAGSSDVILGRASGRLERLSLGSSTDDQSASITSRMLYEIQDEQVMFADLMPTRSGRSSHFVVGAGNKNISLYNVDSNRPVSTIQILSDGNGRIPDRLWSSKFLSAELLAVGHGMNNSPLKLYAVRPEGIASEPLHRYCVAEKNAVYAILPLSENTFLTGLYDGSVAVHDVRTRSVVGNFVDAYDRNHTVYSLLSVQPHLVIAGTSLHTKVCVFDLRASSGRSSTYNLYLGAKTPPWFGKSSVYSLVRAGNSSPTLYAGLEGGVLQLDSFSAFDKHPDAVFAGMTRMKHNKKIGSNFATLSMLRDGVLSSQQPIGRRASQSHGKDFDARWIQNP